MRKISITRDTRLALTTEAAGSLSNSEKCPTLPAEGEGHEGFPPPPDKDLEHKGSPRILER